MSPKSPRTWSPNNYREPWYDYVSYVMMEWGSDWSSADAEIFDGSELLDLSRKALGSEGRRRASDNKSIIQFWMLKNYCPIRKYFLDWWREFPGRPKRPSGNSGRPKWQYAYRATLNELPTFVLFPEILMLAPQIDQPNPFTHISIDLSIIVLLTYLLVRLLASFLLFWLGSATDHRLHTPTATLFQHKAWIDQIQGLWVLCVCLFHLSQSNAAKAMRRVT